MPGTLDTMYILKKSTGYNRIQCFALIVENEDRTVIRCPPIAKWTFGMHIDKVLAYYNKHNYIITEVKGGYYNTI